MDVLNVLEYGVCAVAIAVICAGLVLMLYVAWKMDIAVEKRNVHWSKIVSGMIELNKSPLYYRTVAPLGLVGEDGEPVSVAEDEEYVVEMFHLHSSSPFTNKAFQVVIKDYGSQRVVDLNALIEDIKRPRNVEPEREVFEFEIAPANNVCATWTVYDMIKDDIRLEHPVMGMLRLRNANGHRYNSGDEVVLKQTAELLENGNYVVSYEIVD